MRVGVIIRVWGGWEKVNFYYRVFHRESGTDVQFKVKNRNFSERKVVFEERTYYCQDGASEQGTSVTQIVPTRKEIELLPDYLVCQGHGGFSSLGIILQVHSDTQQEIKKVRIFSPSSGF